MAPKRPPRRAAPSPAAALAPFSSAQVEAELLRRKIAEGEAVIAAHEEGLAVMRDKQARRRHELADRLVAIAASVSSVPSVVR